MPIYEYRCSDCNCRFSRLFWRSSDADHVKCRCGSANVRKLISRVGILRSEESRIENLADPAMWGNLDENDPKSMARMMRKLGHEAGEDLGPEFDEMVDRLEAGESPDSLEDSAGVDERGDNSHTNFT
ncbi:MAG: zinc ribbon domain-containing protein [Acidobacteria bacterium]|nr:zinc ribbon domain-containing protein [Acidobacteriota bacterium]